MESFGVDGCRRPHTVISICGNCLFLAAKFLFFLLFGMLLNLEISHSTFQGDGFGTKAKLLIHQRVFGRGKGCSTDEFTVERLIHLLGILHHHRSSLSLVEHILGLHGTPFVPPEQGRTAQKQYEPCAYGLERVLHTSTITRPCCLCICHKSLISSVHSRLN